MTARHILIRLATVVTMFIPAAAAAHAQSTANSDIALPSPRAGATSDADDNTPAGGSESAPTDSAHGNPSDTPTARSSTDGSAASWKESTAADSAEYSGTEASPLEGTVLIRAFIDSTGRVREMLVDKYDDERLIEPAKRAVARTPFEPAKQQNRPVSVWVQIPVIFKPNKHKPSSAGQYEE